MIKPNKYLIAFGGLAIVLASAVYTTSQKFLPMLLQHTVYYCQPLLQSFSIRVPNSLGTILTALLLLSVSITSVKFVITYIKVVLFRKKLHQRLQNNTVFERVVGKLSLSQKAYLISDEKPFAFCHGIRHPKIYLSTALFSMLDIKELKVILLHEKYHLEHKDSFIMFLAELTRSLFPFFPLLSDLIHNYRIERELAADHEAIHELGDSLSPVAALKKLLTTQPLPQYAFAPSFADHETLEIRIKALMKKDTFVLKFHFLNVLISILSIGAFFVLVVAPVQAIEMHDHESDVMMVCLQNDTCATWCKENRTVMPYTKTPNASYPLTPANQTPLR